MTPLILKRAPVGDNLEDYSVLEDGASASPTSTWSMVPMTPTVSALRAQSRPPVNAARSRFYFQCSALRRRR